MTTDAPEKEDTLALNTTLEKDFVSPLASIRGALEIIRDFADLSAEERARFVDNALADVLRLEQGVEHLAETVYASARLESETPANDVRQSPENPYDERIEFFPEQDIVEVNFHNLRFSSSAVVSGLYDRLDELIEATGHRWFVLVNYRHCSVWPEAWVAFAHRGKKVNVSYSLGTVRYIEDKEGDGSALDEMMRDPDLFPSREDALARIEELRKTAPKHPWQRKLGV